MQSLDRPAQALAASLSALAGFTDAVGFLGMGGFFVSFMSGNSTRVGVGLASEGAAAAIAASLVAAFVAGVTSASLLARRAGRWRKPSPSRSPRRSAISASPLCSAAARR